MRLPGWLVRSLRRAGLQFRARSSAVHDKSQLLFRCLRYRHKDFRGFPAPFPRRYDRPFRGLLRDVLYIRWSLVLFFLTTHRPSRGLPDANLPHLGGADGAPLPEQVEASECAPAPASVDATRKVPRRDKNCTVATTPDRFRHWQRATLALKRYLPTPHQTVRAPGAWRLHLLCTAR